MTVGSELLNTCGMHEEAYLKDDENKIADGLNGVDRKRRRRYRQERMMEALRSVTR